LPRFSSRYGPGQPPSPRRPARTRPRDRAIDRGRTLDACAGAALRGCFEFVGSEVSTSPIGTEAPFFSCRVTIAFALQGARRDHPTLATWCRKRLRSSWPCRAAYMHSSHSRTPPRTPRRPPHPWGKKCGPKRRRPLRENKQSSPLRRIAWSTPGKAHRLPGAREGTPRGPGDALEPNAPPPLPRRAIGRRA